MTNTGGRKKVSIRVSATDITLIDRAARLCGRSRTSFVHDAAVCAAERALLLENPLISMSEEGFAAFTAAVTGGGQPVPEMVALFGRKAPF
jgi:uncharacterized protein (DUF1778 family)